MPKTFKLFTALPFALLISGCVAGGNDVVNTPAEIEANSDTDIDGDGTILENGVESAD